MNCVNGVVSPSFFRDHVLIWEHTSLWLSAVVQGVVEGAVDGAVFGVMFLIVLCVVAQCRCRAAVCFRNIRLAVLLSLAAWLIGGSCAVTYSALYPQGCSSEYFGVHWNAYSLARYAWVRGSYWGITYGGLLVVIAVAARASVSTTTDVGMIRAGRCNKTLDAGLQE